MTVYADLLRYRELFANLFRRDFQAKYKGSFLGIAWSLLNPLALERLEVEATSGKEVFETAGEIATESAVLVEEDPATKGNSFRFFCYFCQIRNHGINFFRQQLRSPEV